MASITTQAQRRNLKFRSYEEVLEDIRQLRETPHLQLGKWPLSKAVMHLAKGMHASIDGVEFPVPLKLRILGRLIYRPIILYWRFPPGARLPRPAAKALIPEGDVDFEEAMELLLSGIHRLRSETHRFAHPILGKLSIAQWDRFHRRHAELHLSFFVPEAG